MLITAYLIIYLLVFAVGAVAGSFLDVLIYRIPLGRGFVLGFSFCPACKHRLFPRDLVPIFSYLALGRKCRYCKEPIRARYPVVELMAALLAVLSWSAFMPPAAFLVLTPAPRYAGLLAGFADGAAVGKAALFFAVLAILLCVAWIDHDTMEIPDSLNIALAVCGVIYIFIEPDIGLKSHLIGVAVAAVPLFVLGLFVEGAFGFGDVKLMAAAGLFLGWQNCLVALFAGIIIGGVCGIFLLVTRKKSAGEHFAFGPALCVGIGFAMFAGERVIGWYFGFM